MKLKLKNIIFLLSIIIFAFTQSSTASAEDKITSDLHLKADKTQIHAEFKDESREQSQDNDEDNDFEITGTVTAVVGNNFVLSGQTIFIDPSRVSKFTQKGILVVGAKVKVKGVLINGVKFAENINVVGTGQGRFKFDTAGSNIRVGIKANGPVQEIEAFLNQILSLFKSFV